MGANEAMVPNSGRMVGSARSAYGTDHDQEMNAEGYYDQSQSSSWAGGADGTWQGQDGASYPTQDDTSADASSVAMGSE